MEATLLLAGVQKRRLSFLVPSSIGCGLCKTKVSIHVQDVVNPQNFLNFYIKKHKHDICANFLNCRRNFQLISPHA